MPLFPFVQSINYNYINNFLENYFCCQITITITRIIPLRIIYVIISWTMVDICRSIARQYKLWLTGRISLENEYVRNKILGEYWSRGTAEATERIRGGSSILVWRISRRILAANFSRELFGLVSPGLQALPKNSRPKFTPKIVSIPLQFSHFETHLFLKNADFLLTGGDQELVS